MDASIIKKASERLYESHYLPRFKNLINLDFSQNIDIEIRNRNQIEATIGEFFIRGELESVSFDVLMAIEFGEKEILCKASVRQGVTKLVRFNCEFNTGDRQELAFFHVFAPVSGNGNYFYKTDDLKQAMMYLFTKQLQENKEW